MQNEHGLDLHLDKCSRRLRYRDQNTEMKKITENFEEKTRHNQP